MGVIVAMSDWNAADKAYLAHHAGCTQCQSAGISRTGMERCAAGKALWRAYCAAGDPPHFTWLRKRPQPNRKRHGS